MFFDLPVAGKTIEALGLVVSLLAGFSAGAGHDETGPPGKRLEELIGLALENNRSIKDAHYGVVIAESQVTQARSGYFPRVDAAAGSIVFDEPIMFNMLAGSISFDLSNLGLPPFGDFDPSKPLINDKDMEVPIADQNVNFGLVTLTQPLYAGGKITGYNRQADQGLKVARQRERLKEQEVVYTVVRRHNDVVLTGRLEALGSSTLTRLRMVLLITTNVYEAGSQKVDKLDLLQTRMIVSSLENYIEILKESSKLAREGLKFAIGLDGNEEMALARQDFPLPPFEGTCEAAVEQALRSRPETGQLEAGIEALEAGVDVAWSGYLPNVALAGGYLIDDNSIRITDGHTFYGGLLVSYPLFEGFLTMGKVDEARARLHQLENKKHLLKQGISIQVRKSCLEMERSEKQVAISKKALTDAEEYLRVAERTYQAELIELDALLKAQIAEALMRAQHLKARYDLSNSVLGLNKNLGDLSSYYGTRKR